MKKGLAEAVADEEGAVKSYDELMAAKKKEVGALTASIEAKIKQIGETSVSLVQMKADLTDTRKALIEDKKYLQGLAKSCKTKTAEWKERSKTRAEELVALADTIKILNDDDALDLFKKTLPGAGASASFVQMTTSVAAQQARALEAIGKARKQAFSSQPSQLDF